MAASSKIAEELEDFKPAPAPTPTPESTPDELDHDFLTQRYLDIRRWSIYDSEVDNSDEPVQPGADGFGGLGSGPYHNTLAATIAAVAGPRFVHAAGPDEEPPEVSRWSSSSSSNSSSSSRRTEEAVIADGDDHDCGDDGEDGLGTQWQFRDQSEMEMAQGVTRFGEIGSVGEVDMTGTKNERDTKRDIKSEKQKQKQKQKKTQDRTREEEDEDEEEEEEVIYDLDERAMSKLPDNLQHNMREIQRERFERLQRDNNNVPIRKQSDYRATRSGERWFKNLVQQFPTTSSRSTLRLSRDTDYTQTGTCRSEDQEDPDIIRPVRAGDVHEEYYEDTTGEHHGNYPGRYKRVGSTRGRRRHRAASIKDTTGYNSGGGGHLDEGPRRSEPCLPLPYLKNLEQSSTADYTKTDTGEQQQKQIREAQNQEQGQGADEETPQIQKKRSFLRPSGMRARLKKSMHMLSMAFKGA